MLDTPADGVAMPFHAGNDCSQHFAQPRVLGAEGCKLGLVVGQPLVAVLDADGIYCVRHFRLPRFSYARLEMGQVKAKGKARINPLSSGI